MTAPVVDINVSWLFSGEDPIASVSSLFWSAIEIKHILYDSLLPPCKSNYSFAVVFGDQQTVLPPLSFEHHISAQTLKLKADTSFVLNFDLYVPYIQFQVASPTPQVSSAVWSLRVKFRLSTHPSPSNKYWWVLVFYPVTNFSHCQLVTEHKAQSLFLLTLLSFITMLTDRSISEGTAICFSVLLVAIHPDQGNHHISSTARRKWTQKSISKKRLRSAMQSLMVYNKVLWHC